MCRSKDQGGRRCAGHRTPTPAPRMPGSPATTITTTTGKGSAFSPTPAPRVDDGPLPAPARLSKATVAEQAPTPAPRAVAVPDRAGGDRDDLTPAEPVQPAGLDDDPDDVGRAGDLDDEHAAWRAGHGPDTPAEARLRQALTDLASAPGGDFVHLDTVRAALDDMPREEFDTALRALQRDPDVTLVPDSAQWRLTREQKAAAVRVGGEDKHMVRISTSGAAALDQIDQSEHDDWRAGHGPDTPHEAHLRTVMGDLTGRDGEWMRLSELRAAVPDLSREEFDTAFQGLMSDPDISPAPDADQARLTPADRAARLHFGGGQYHVDIVKLRTRTATSGKD